MIGKSAVLFGFIWAQVASAQIGPTVIKAYNPGLASVNGTILLMLILTNPNPATTLTNVGVFDSVPTASFEIVSLGERSCDTVAFNSVMGAVEILHPSLAPGASCFGSVIIKALAAGVFTNTTDPPFSAQATGTAATAILVVGTPTGDGPFQVSYAANTNIGESYINITNDGANGAPLLGPGFGGAVGNICVNAYAFSGDEQLISCCSCLVTPGGLANLGVNRDLTAKALTGVIPSSIVVKLLATLAGANGSGTSCTNSAATATLAGAVPGMLAWATTVQNGGPTSAAYRVTETPFRTAMLSAGELASITGRCAGILGNGSGFGICRSCQTGALGASKF